MPLISRPDGARIHYEVSGEGMAAVVLATYWSWSPGVYDELLGELATDHRVAVYHLRGTGGSSRIGPYEMATDETDLEAVVEAVGGPAALIGVGDSANRAASLGGRRPDLVTAVITFGAGPFALASLEGEEGMVTSSSVVGAFVEMVERNYRGAMRNLVEATNPKMQEDELRNRIDALVEFCGPEAAAGRLRSWIDHDPREAARRLGARLWILTAPDVAGVWLPPWGVRKRLIEETLPEARLVVFEGDTGPVSRPRETAEVIRQATALRADPTETRK